MKRINIRLSAIVILISILTTLSGCEKAETANPNKISDVSSSEKSLPEAYDKSIFALDTFINLRLYDSNAAQNAELAEKRITELENILSVTNNESDVSKINSSSGEDVPVDDVTFNVITTAADVSERTYGALDISVYPIVKLWGFTTDSFSVPSQAEIEAELKNVDYTKLSINESSHSVMLSDNMQIDLGAVAKGYISEDIKNLLKEKGVESAVLSFGGNIQTIGTKNGELWKVGIKYPFTEDSFAVLSVGESAVVTSATDQRFFEEHGKKYHHIIDPKTGYPVENGTFSATVVCESGAKADALSTSLFVMGVDDAKKLYKSSDDFEFIILNEDNTVYVSGGLKGSFKLSDDYSNLKVEFVEK